MISVQWCDFGTMCKLGSVVHLVCILSLSFLPLELRHVNDVVTLGVCFIIFNIAGASVCMTDGCFEKPTKCLIFMIPPGQIQRFLIP